MRLRSLLLIALLFLTRTLRAADTYKPDPGPHAVAILDLTWIDPSRPNPDSAPATHPAPFSTTPTPATATTQPNASRRQLPIRIYYPADLATLKEPAPIIIFSHGLAASRTVYGVWSTHWASHGYIVVHPQHAGSDSAIVLNGLDHLTDSLNYQTAIDRVQDIHFVLDQIEKLNAGALPANDSVPPALLAPFKNHLDLRHIGMSGHSYGAFTTLFICGQSFNDRGAIRNSADPRISAGLAMSPNQSYGLDQATAFASVKVPILHMTGTQDFVFGITPADHRVAFDHSKAEACLITFQGANHVTFIFPTTGNAMLAVINKQYAAQTGRQARPPATGDGATYLTLIRQSTTAWWDAQLRQDPAAKSWLLTQFPKTLSKNGTFETKNIP